MRLKSAPLDLILQANGEPTGDELRAQAREARHAATRAEINALPVYLNSNQRRNLRCVIEKANQPEQDCNQ